MRSVHHEADTEAEIALLLAVSKRDRDAFRELHQRYSGVLYSTAYKVLNDESEAEDVVQDVFVQIWDKADMYDPLRGRPLTWAVTLTRNKAIDRLRSSQRRFRLKDEFEREVETTSHRPSVDSVDRVYSREKNRIIRSAVLELSSEQREAIEMAFFKGLTQHEIAEELQQPLGTVKARIRRGMMKLKKVIKNRL
jgi:RNA polymerase sigma-70 factor (ECF subfamily)